MYPLPYLTLTPSTPHAMTVIYPTPGMSRSTIAVTVIVLEACGNNAYLLPLMLTFAAARYDGHLFTRSTHSASLLIFTPLLLIYYIYLSYPRQYLPLFSSSTNTYPTTGKWDIFNEINFCFATISTPLTPPTISISLLPTY